jgi:hypothetical protein
MAFDDYRGVRKLEIDATNSDVGALSSIVYGIQASGVSYAQLSAIGPSGSQVVGTTYEPILQWDEAISVGKVAATISTSGFISVSDTAETTHYLMMANLTFGGDNNRLYSIALFDDEQLSADVSLLVKKNANEDLNIGGTRILSLSPGDTIDLRVKADSAARFNLIGGSLILIRIGG